MLTAIMHNSDPFMRLKNSSYRRELHLNELEKGLVLKQGFIGIIAACENVIDSLSNPHHSHRDTPHRGVVPKAQQATATCCRKCLCSWHGIPRFRQLTEEEKAYIIRLIVRWVKKEIASGMGTIKNTI
ncbi:MAG: DUF4186 family protein [Candidatus Woesearchaeota archaeon]